MAWSIQFPAGSVLTCHSAGDACGESGYPGSFLRQYFIVPEGSDLHESYPSPPSRCLMFILMQEQSGLLGQAPLLLGRVTGAHIKTAQQNRNLSRALQGLLIDRF